MERLAGYRSFWGGKGKANDGEEVKSYRRGRGREIEIDLLISPEKVPLPYEVLAVPAEHGLLEEPLDEAVLVDEPDRPAPERPRAVHDGARRSQADDVRVIAVKVERRERGRGEHGARADAVHGRIGGLGRGAGRASHGRDRLSPSRLSVKSEILSRLLDRLLASLAPHYIQN